MKKISLSSGTLQLRYGDKGALKLLKDAGFDAVDLDLDSYAVGVLPNVYRMPHDEFAAYFEDVKKYADEIGIEIAQTHSLVGAYRDDAEFNERKYLICTRSIEATKLLGCKYCVIHCISTFHWGYEATDELMHEKNQAMYDEFIPYAEKFGVNITLESFGGVTVNGVPGYDRFADPEKMMYEYESLKTQNKAFCFDCGHTNVAANGGYLPIPDFIRYFGDRIKVLHLHDNNGCSDQHLIPKSGSIKWTEVFDALDEIGYNGVYNFEISLPFGTDHLESCVKFLGGYLREFVERKGKMYIGPADESRNRDEGPFR